MLVNHILDNIILEGKYKYSVYISIASNRNSDFNVTLEFNNLTLDLIKEINELYLLSKPLELQSDLIKKLDYPITHIVVNSFRCDSLMSMEGIAFQM